MNALLPRIVSRIACIFSPRTSAVSLALVDYNTSRQMKEETRRSGAKHRKRESEELRNYRKVVNLLVSLSFFLSLPLSILVSSLSALAEVSSFPRCSLSPYSLFRTVSSSREEPFRVWADFSRDKVLLPWRRGCCVCEGPLFLFYICLSVFEFLGRATGS